MNYFIDKIILFVNNFSEDTFSFKPRVFLRVDRYLISSLNSLFQRFSEIVIRIKVGLEKNKGMAKWLVPTESGEIFNIHVARASPVSKTDTRGC